MGEDTSLEGKQGQEKAGQERETKEGPKTQMGSVVSSVGLSSQVVCFLQRISAFMFPEETLV